MNFANTETGKEFVCAVNNKRIDQPQLTISMRIPLLFFARDKLR